MAGRIDRMEVAQPQGRKRIRIGHGCDRVNVGQVKSGVLRAIGVTGEKRYAPLPDVGSIAEAGFPGLTMESLQGMFGPKGMPLAVREQIAADVRAVIERIAPEIAKHFLSDSNIGKRYTLPFNLLKRLMPFSCDQQDVLR